MSASCFVMKKDRHEPVFKKEDGVHRFIVPCGVRLKRFHQAQKESSPTTHM